jgi:hypothetical protein
MVSHLGEKILAWTVTLGVWRAKVCGKEAQDISEGHLKIVHLVGHFGLVERTHVCMAPGMSGYLEMKVRKRFETALDRAYLMSFSMHTPDNIWPSCLRNVDLTLAQIVPCYEKGGFGAI